MCNSDIDHRILSEVMIYLCNQLHGLLVYDGLICALLPRGMQGKDHDKAVKMATESLANLPGDIDPIYHDPNDRDAGAMHVSDTTFLESWLEHPQFRLPK